VTRALAIAIRLALLAAVVSAGVLPCVCDVPVANGGARCHDDDAPGLKAGAASCACACMSASRETAAPRVEPAFALHAAFDGPPLVAGDAVESPVSVVPYPAVAPSPPQARLILRI